MTDLKEYTAFDCAECPLSDCYPANPRCPVLRRKLQEQGLPLPEIRELLQEAPQMGRPKRIQAAPENYRSRQEYLKKYKHNYRRVSLRGVKLHKVDIEILEAHFERHGEGLEEEVSALLELWARLIREKRKES